MVIKTVQQDLYKVTTMDLIKEGLELGGYNIQTDTGWYHSALVKLAEKHGIPADTKKFIPASEIATLIDSQNYVLASIKSPRGGHLLLLYGFRLNDRHKLEGFWYHDPYNYKKDGENLFIYKDRFNSLSTRRAVVFTPLP